jgi:hypothetical protein
MIIYTVGWDGMKEDRRRERKKEKRRRRKISIKQLHACRCSSEALKCVDGQRPQQEDDDELCT